MMIQLHTQEERERESKREREREKEKEKKRKRSHILGLQCSSSKGPRPSTVSYMPWQTGIIRSTFGHNNGFAVGPLAAEGIVADGFFCIELPAPC